MHQVFRGVARTASIVALAVSGGALVAVPPAFADIGVEVELVCSGKSGTHEVALRIDTTVPSSGTVGQPIQPGTIRVDVALPRELVKEAGASSPGGESAPPVTGVTPSSAPTVALGGVAVPKVAVRDPGGARNGGWPAFALATAPPRDDGAVHLTGSGVAPPVVPHSPGGLSWSVGEMNLSLVPDETATEKDAGELALRCVAEKETVLGTVQVNRGDEAAVPGASSASPRQAADSGQSLCQVIPDRGEDPRYAINPDPKLQEVFEDPEAPSTLTRSEQSGLMFCIKATGFFNIKKAGNAAPIAVENTARATIESRRGNPIFGPNWSEYRGYFVNHTYPTPATMLGFGFMPTRAVAKAVQVESPDGGENAPITGNLRILQKYGPELDMAGPTVDRQQVRAGAYVRIEAGQAEVNGISLPLGDNCVTSPTELRATGFLGTLQTGVADYWDGQTLIAEDVEIPPFSGCGVGEDLSPILTASVSGSGNYANLESGQWCSVENGNRCVNGEGRLPETFTVIPGGKTTAVAEPFILGNEATGAEFRCEKATMQFDMKSGRWKSRFRLGKGDMSLDGCTVKATDGSVYQVDGEVTQDGALWLNMGTDLVSGEWQMTINGMLLNASVNMGGGQKCTLRIGDFMIYSVIDQRVKNERPGFMLGTYDNGTGALTLTRHNLKPTIKSTCSIPGFTDLRNAFRTHEGKFTFKPGQQLIPSAS